MSPYEDASQISIKLCPRRGNKPACSSYVMDKCPFQLSQQGENPPTDAMV